jgi:hypothetical protein
MTDRPGRYAHTAECRDDFCVHPIQCEADGICPPSPGGDVDYARLAEVNEDAANRIFTIAREALAERDALRATLTEVLGHFTESGHPGEPCRRTAWIPLPMLARWRAACKSPEDGRCDCRGEACVGERSTCRAFGPLEER